MTQHTPTNLQTVRAWPKGARQFAAGSTER